MVTTEDTHKNLSVYSMMVTNVSTSGENRESNST